MKKIFILLCAFAAFGVLCAATESRANIAQMKVYRTVYPNYKPNCGYCHVNEKPKKEDGQHELNAYGLKLKELMAGDKLTEEIVQSAGNHEDFEAKK